MTDKAKLESLLTALRAAPGPSRELDLEIAAIMTGERIHVLRHLDVRRFTGSLDAAAAFRELLLPGWDYASGNNSVPWAWVRKTLGEHIFMERCATECLSSCAAVIAAKIAQETKHEIRHRTD
jgi:hypothetical protein